MITQPGLNDKDLEALLLDSASVNGAFTPAVVANEITSVCNDYYGYITSYKIKPILQVTASITIISLYTLSSLLV
jgi:hypothetical protein